MMTDNSTSPGRTIQNAITAYLAAQKPIVKTLWTDLQYLRNVPLKKQKLEQQERLDRPVATSIRPDRLRTGPGIEICLIFRSRGCQWARSDSGGCTMCGYINDRAGDELTENDLWKQFQHGLDIAQETLSKPDNKIIFKIFTSGSFFDPQEFSESLQLKIIESLTKIPTIKEIVIESRPQFITEKILQQYRTIIKDQYFEVGIGLESADDFIRLNIINKGFTWAEFSRCVHLLHQYQFGAKAYLLFKPPFVSEYAAILDTHNSIRKCIEIGVDTISVNPTNIQIHTVCEQLFKNREFRPPWLFSLLWVLKHSITAEELKNVRLISDPSAAGKERGVHNDGDLEINQKYLAILRDFVLSQDLNLIPEKFSPLESKSYYISLMLGNK